jgi:hypothetical protein
MENDFRSYIPKLRGYFLDFVGVFGIYALWILLHYFAPHAYVYFCTPLSLQGFALSPFVAAAPHCQAIRWVIYNGGNSIIAMWFLAGSWLLRFILPIAIK